MIPEDTRFDAHCHIFNLNYLLLESGNILFDMILGHYPKARVALRADQRSVFDPVINFIKWINEIGNACLGSEEENLNQVLSVGRKAWSDKGAGAMTAIPLMMDIYYMFAPVVSAGEDGRWALMDEHQPMPTADEFDTAMEELRAHLGVAGVDGDDIEFICGQLQEDHPNQKANCVKASYVETRGFAYHRDHLQDLKAKRPNDLFPFFAVDPRRPHVVDAVIRDGFVGKGRPFQGVKLYPRLGYDPACDALRPLFQWCAEQRIPITAHCSPGGFPPVGGYDDLGHPDKYRPVLNEYPNLILDLAHFGSVDQNWADAVARLVADYKNVYSDLSCFTEAHRIPAFKSAYWNKPRIQERTMFGTDFDVFYFTHVGIHFEAYYEAFREVNNPGAFNDAELLLLSSTNPRSFLQSVV